MDKKFSLYISQFVNKLAKNGLAGESIFFVDHLA